MPRTVLAALTLCALATPVRAELPEPWRVVVPAFVDGRFADLPCRTGPASQASLAALGAAATAEPGALALSPGDLLGASALARLAVEADVDALARAVVSSRLAGAALGHRDLTADRAVLVRFLAATRAAGVRHVASNLQCAPAAAALCDALDDATDPPLLLRDPTGGTTALLAFLAPELLAGAARDRREGLTFEPLAAAVPRELARARAAGATRVVLVVDPAGGQELATALQAAGWAGPGDLVIARELPDEVLGVELAGERAALVGARREGAVVFGDGLGARPAGRGEVPAVVEEYATGLGKQVCDRHAVGLRSGRLPGPLDKESFTDLLLDVLRQRAGTDLALINRKAVRGQYPLQGQLTLFDVAAALPFEDVLFEARVRGKVLRAFATAPRAAGFRLRGLEVAGSAVRVNGRPLDPEQVYSVVTTGYVAALGAAGLGEGVAYEPLEGANTPQESLVAWLDEPQDREGGLRPPIDPARRTRWQLGLALDGALSDVRIDNPSPATYGDAQLARSAASTLALDARLSAAADHPDLSFQNLLRVEYALARTVTSGVDSGFVEARDLVSSRSSLALRLFQDDRRWYHPLPDLELFAETEFDRPRDGTRDYHHLLLRPTLGARLDLAPRLSFRLGAGLESEVLSESPVKGVALARLELAQGRLVTVGARGLDGRLLLEASFVNPWQHLDAQVRAGAQLAMPLWSWLSVTVGYDLFLRSYERLPVAFSGDLTVGLKLALDHALQQY